MHSLMLVLNLKLLQPITSEGGRVGAEPTFVAIATHKTKRALTQRLVHKVRDFLQALSMYEQNNQHPLHPHSQFVLCDCRCSKGCYFSFILTLCVMLDDVELNLMHFVLFII